MDDQLNTVKPDSPLSEPSPPSPDSTPQPPTAPNNIPQVQPQVNQPQQTPTFVNQTDQNGTAVKRSKRKFFVAFVFIIIVVLAVGGVFAFMGRSTPTNAKLSYSSENYTLGITDNNDYTVNNPYALAVNFNDSWNPKPTCPSLQPGFVGKITVTSMSDGAATFTITQNKKPYTNTSNVAPPLCGTGTAVVAPDSTQYTFSDAWLENGPAFKTLTIQGKRYTLHVDKTSYTLTLTNGSIITGTSFFPENIGSLHSNPPNCMSVAQLQAYAQKNGMEIAEDRYPGLDQALAYFPSVAVVTPYNEQILVIINSGYIKLAQATSQKETCQIWTGVGDVAGMVGNHSGNITVGSDD